MKLDFLKEIQKNPILIKYKIYILPAVSAIICLGLISLVIVPQVKGLLEAGKKNTELNHRLEVLQTKINALEKTDKSSIRENIKTSLSALPDDKNIPNAITQILYFLNINSLQLESLSSSGAGDGESVQIRMDISGNINNLKNFMARLKEAPRIIKIQSLDITGGRVTGNIQASIVLSVFFAQLPDKIGGIEQPVPQVTPQDLEVLSLIKSNAAAFPTITATSSAGVKGKADPFQ